MTQPIALLANTRDVSGYGRAFFHDRHQKHQIILLMVITGICLVLCFFLVNTYIATSDKLIETEKLLRAERAKPDFFNRFNNTLLLLRQKEAALGVEIASKKELAILYEREKAGRLQAERDLRLVLVELSKFNTSKKK
jgi:hypothetical protein